LSASWSMANGLSPKDRRWAQGPAGFCVV